MLQQFVDMGQAVDLDDAAEWLAHQQRVAAMGTAVEKAAANAEFAQARQARLAGR